MYISAGWSRYGIGMECVCNSYTIDMENVFVKI